jgi:hypothetical protein
MDYDMSNAFLNLGGLGFATFNNIRQGAWIASLSNYYSSVLHFTSIIMILKLSIRLYILLFQNIFESALCLMKWGTCTSLSIRNWRGGSLSAFICKLSLVAMQWFIIFGCIEMLFVMAVLLVLKSRF